MNDDEERFSDAEKLQQLTIASRRAEEMLRPSQKITPNLHESFAIADEAAKAATAPLQKGLKWNNVLSGAFMLGIGGFLAYVLSLALAVQTVQAQEKAKTDKNSEDIKSLKEALADQNTRLGTVERSTIRSEVMNEQIVIRLGMIPPPRVLADAGTDGGR